MEEQAKFIEALQAFIAEHPYYKTNGGEFNTFPTEDKTEFFIHDPNGDYEGIYITITGKP